MALTISCSSKASHISGSQRIVAWKEIHSSSRIVRSNDSHRSCERAYHWSMAYHLQPHSPDNHPPRAGVGEKQKFLSQSDKSLFISTEALQDRALFPLIMQMVGEWMIDPIKIPWFRRPGSSWSRVYLVKGGSRPNLTEESLSAAMGFDVIGEHTGADHNHNIVMPFGSKSPGSEGPES
ncbi:hypothetical protein M5K25_006665 [Dendrobium thyrsiflorum]|uniref:Uncharacterized protein n=1 Tax=Dendrobium thyrsiflorum TaxID=117978 RepID=A0ABD0VCF5_DENTH